MAGGADPRTFSGSRACTVQASALEELMAQLSGQLPAPFDGEAARRRAGGGGVVQLELFDLDFGEWVEATSIGDRATVASDPSKPFSNWASQKITIAAGDGSGAAGIAVRILPCHCTEVTFRKTAQSSEKRGVHPVSPPAGGAVQ